MDVKLFNNIEVLQRQKLELLWSDYKGTQEYSHLEKIIEKETRLNRGYEVLEVETASPI